MPHLPNSTILVVGGQILTTGDFVFEADQGSLDQIIDDFGPPIINFISPSIVMEGERIEIIMSGNRTYNPLALGIGANPSTGASDVVVEDVYVDNDGQITARIDVLADAAAAADDLRSITVTTLPGQLDSDGQPIEQQQEFQNKLRIYFGPPALGTIGYEDGSGDAIVNQGDQVTATFTGQKFYDQSWGAQQQMSSTLENLAAQGVTVASMTVDSDTQATAVLNIAANAQRDSYSIKVQTYSGESLELANNLNVYYSEPTLVSLTEQGGADMTSIAANETKTLILSGTRLEGVDSPLRIQIGQVDNSGNFLASPPQEDGSGFVNLSTYATISNVAASTPAGDGTNHSVSFDLHIADDIPSDLQNIGFKVTALDAAGSLQAVLPLPEAFSIDAAEPTINSIAVAGRPAGDASSYVAGSGALQLSVNGANFYGADLSASLSGDAAGITVSNVTKASAQLVTMDIDIAADVTPSVRDITLTFEGGSATSSNAASKLEIILPAPTLSTDPAQNHLTLDRPNTGTPHVHTFDINGTNFMNIWDDGNTSDGLRATDGDFVNYYQLADEMTATLTSNGAAVAGITDFSLSAMNATTARGTVTVASNATLGLIDLQVETRSGQTALLAGVLDVIPGDPEFTALAPDAIMEGSGKMVVTLTGANFHPSGDGAIAGSTLLGIKDPYDPGFTNCDFGTQGQTNQSVSFRRVWDFASPIGSELVDVAIDPNGVFEIAKLTDTYNQQEMFGKMAGVNNGTQNPDSAWGSSHADLTADEWIVVRVKSGEAVGTYSDTLTASTEASPSQSVSLDVEIVTDAQELINTATTVSNGVQAALPAAQAGDPGALGFVNAMRNPLASMSAAMTQFIADHGPSGGNTMSGGEVTDMTNAIALADTLVADIDAL